MTNSELLDAMIGLMRERDNARTEADAARTEAADLRERAKCIQRERDAARTIVADLTARLDAARAEADTARDMREIAWVATANWRRHAVSAIRERAELQAEVERLRGDLTARLDAAGEDKDAAIADLTKRLDAAWVAATQPAVPVGDVMGAIFRIRASLDNLEARVNGAMPRKGQA